MGIEFEIRAQVKIPLARAGGILIVNWKLESVLTTQGCYIICGDNPGTFSSEQIVKIVDSLL